MMSGFNPGPREFYQGDNPILHGHAREIGALQADMKNVKTQLSDIDEKLTRLVDAANMGKGVWWASEIIRCPIQVINAGTPQLAEMTIESDGSVRITYVLANSQVQFNFSFPAANLANAVSLE